MTTLQGHQRLDGTHDTQRAWWSLLGFVPSFGLAFFVGEGLISLFGYPTGTADEPPVWAMLVSTIPALVVFALPAVFAVHFGRRAVAAGDSQGRIPMWLAVAVAAGFALLNVLSGLAYWLA